MRNYKIGLTIGMINKIVIVFSALVFSTCAFARGQVYLDNKTAKRVVSELLEFDSLKKQYSLMDQRYTIIEDRYNDVNKSYLALIDKYNQQTLDFDAYKEKMDKRTKRVSKLAGIVTFIIVTTVISEHREKIITNDGVSRDGEKRGLGAGILPGLGAGLSVYFSIKVLL